MSASTGKRSLANLPIGWLDDSPLPIAWLLTAKITHNGVKHKTALKKSSYVQEEDR